MAESTKQLDTIVVHKCGLISGVGRYTEIPFAAEELSENNLLFPESAERREFEATRSEKDDA